jgi:hypothetical protein
MFVLNMSQLKNNILVRVGANRKSLLKNFCHFQAKVFCAQKTLAWKPITNSHGLNTSIGL